MDKPTTKKTWGKPRLLILSRATPDESVLFHCKRIGATSGNTRPLLSGQTGCDQTGEKVGSNCGNCQARAGS